MKRKQLLILLIIVLVLCALVFLQVREWRRFDWEKFEDGISGIAWWKILIGVFFVYAADFLRAIRWKIFLRPTRPEASWKGLVSPQYVGFAGLGLLGRPGELVRPYLIAHKTGTSLSSQMAIWFVERAFDIGAVTIMLSSDIFLVPYMRHQYPEWRAAGYGLIAALLGLVVMLWALYRRGPGMANWVCRRLSWISSDFAASLEKKLRAVAGGLHTIKDWRSFLQISLISLAIWVLVALAYRQVTHAYPPETGIPELGLPEVILLMGASVAGGIIQLPVIGGGSQLATIAVLSQTFGFADAPELAVSCGILLWLVTFMSVIPPGVVLAHREHLSLRKLTEEREEEAEAEEAAAIPPTPSLPTSEPS